MIKLSLAVVLMVGCTPSQPPVTKVHLQGALRENQWLFACLLSEAFGKSRLLCYSSGGSSTIVVDHVGSFTMQAAWGIGADVTGYDLIQSEGVTIEEFAEAVEFARRAGNGSMILSSSGYKIELNRKECLKRWPLPAENAELSTDIINLYVWRHQDELKNQR
jgi:hypothetical protein